MKKNLVAIIVIPIILILLVFIVKTVVTPKSKVITIAVKQEKQVETKKQEKVEVKKEEQKEQVKNENTKEETEKNQEPTTTKEEKKKKAENNKKIVEENYDYNANIRMLAFGNEIVTYDGKKLVKKNDEFKNIFDVRLVASSFIIRQESEKIYILDKSQKILYKIDKNGEIESQVKITENVQNLYPLKNGDVIVSYNTSIGTDGILIYDKDMKQKTNINYPNSLVNTVSYDENNGNIYVSVQVTNLPDIQNTIYLYNSKYEVQSINNYKNLVTLSLVFKGSNKFLLDPNKLYILDEKYKNVATIEAQDSFEHMIIDKDIIYLQDGSRDIKQYDRSGKFIKEKIFKEQIKNILKNGSTIIYVGKSSVSYDEEKIELAKDIEKSILLGNNKLVLFFKGSVEIWQIPS